MAVIAMLAGALLASPRTATADDLGAARLSFGGGLRLAGGVTTAGFDYLDLADAYGYSRFLVALWGVDAAAAYPLGDSVDVGLHGAYLRAWGGSSGSDDAALALRAPEVGLFGRTVWGRRPGRPGGVGLHVEAGRMYPSLDLRGESVKDAVTYYRLAIFAQIPGWESTHPQLLIGYTFANFEDALAGLDVGLGGLTINFAFSFPVD